MSVVPFITDADVAAALPRVAAHLASGGLLAYPTETVYGLGSRPRDADVRALAALKGRRKDKPFLLLVSERAMAERFGLVFNDTAEALARAFWPGPLTLVLAKAADIPDVVTAGGRTVGIRWPGHPLMQAVIRECGFPLAAPSANPSGQVSPTNAEHVRRLLGARVPLIVDGGQSQIGIESTVIDLTTQPARVLRPGMIHEESLVAALGSEVRGPAPDGPGQGTLRSPGQLEKHYSPRARVLVLEWSGTESLRAQLARRGIPEAECHVVAHSRIPAAERFAEVSVIPRDAEVFAQALYAEFHRCDEAGARVIVVESVPDRPEWRGVADRLRRAGAESDA